MNQVPIEAVRLFLHRLFEKWGLPKAIKTDNGAPFGLPSRDTIPIMSLWLVAWGIQPILNRPKRPQDNGTVERAQGTSSRWAEIHKAKDLQDLQQRLDNIIEEQRDKYPVKRLNKATRTQVFPDLYPIIRPFEENNFDSQAAFKFLSAKTLQRKIAQTGSCSVYGKTYYIDYKLKGSIAYCKFDTIKGGWAFYNMNNEQLKFYQDDRFVRDNLFLLTVCQ